MTYLIETKEVGSNEYQAIYNQLADFVEENFELLYEGAVRLGLNISADYYASERISIDREDRESHKEHYTGVNFTHQTRLNGSFGQKTLQYVNGVKYSDENYPTEEDFKVLCLDIQLLINAAAEDVKAGFKVSIEKV